MAVATGLVLAGCSGGNTDGSNETAPTTTKETSEHNSADVEFAQQMIPHHEQALDMAKLARTRAESAEVKELAADIEEIRTMTGWLEEWGEDLPSGTGGHMMEDGSMMEGDSMGEGMMSDQEMTGLERARRASFDRMFLTMMIRHHEGAVVMAKKEQRDGKNADAIELAKRIESAQTAEIKLMKDLLSE
jgi:uncharacterized protein (DUF305 family)